MAGLHLDGLTLSHAGGGRLAGFHHADDQGTYQYRLQHRRSSVISHQTSSSALSTGISHQATNTGPQTHVCRGLWLIRMSPATRWICRGGGAAAAAARYADYELLAAGCACFFADVYMPQKKTQACIRRSGKSKLTNSPMLSNHCMIVILETSTKL